MENDHERVDGINTFKQTQMYTPLFDLGLRLDGLLA
jgi:hypothetical protein